MLFYDTNEILWKFEILGILKVDILTSSIKVSWNFENF
jgi:hypothetical protein